MSQVFTQEGFRALRWAYGVALSGLAVAGFLVGGSYLYVRLEQENNKQSIKSQADMRTRLENAKRERDDLYSSASIYKEVVAKGVFAPPERLDLIEALQKLKTRYRLIALEYDIAPQRTLKLTSGTSIAAVTPLGARIKLKILAYHDGDLLAFLDAFSRLQRGYFALDRCMMKRAPETQTIQVTGPISDRLDDNETPEGVVASRQAVPNQIDQSITLMEAECTLEWITLEDKSAKRP